MTPQNNVNPSATWEGGRHSQRSRTASRQSLLLPKHDLRVALAEGSHSQGEVVRVLHHAPVAASLHSLRDFVCAGVHALLQILDCRHCREVERRAILPTEHQVLGGVRLCRLVGDEDIVLVLSLSPPTDPEQGSWVQEDHCVLDVRLGIPESLIEPPGPKLHALCEEGPRPSLRDSGSRHPVKSCKNRGKRAGAQRLE